MFMYTVRPVAAGSEVHLYLPWRFYVFSSTFQIFTTYGELPNARLLLRYGFAEENNDYDYVQVPSFLAVTLI